MINIRPPRLVTCRLALSAAIISMASSVLYAQEAARTLAPAEAAKHVNEKVTVELQVKSTGGNRNSYLNSAPDYSAADNFTIYIPEAARSKFKELKIDKPDEYYYGKTIDVTGAVVLARGKPQIVVTDPAQISVNQAKSGPPVFKRTHVYKRAQDLSIRADSYRFIDHPNQPVVVWIHGGGLINGHREGVPSWLMEACRQNDWVLVSLDYRLAPEVQLPDIISDLADAFRWIAKEGPVLFQADPKRIAVVGGSAGGYLTLVAGYRAQPRPVALVSLWGYGDLIGPWYSQPSEHPRHQRTRLSREKAYEQVAGTPVSDSRDRQGSGSAFYLYLRQHGEWPQAVSGWDPHTEAQKFDPYMPLKNITKDYPPTLLIHGEEDTDVPFEQSKMMAAELAKHHVEHKLIAVAGGEHGLSGAKPEDVTAAYRAAVEFLKQHLQAR
jgi:acetyl esterase/lipase